jgi:3-oxoacyl-[acyl-carrier-protein] synthase II
MDEWRDRPVKRRVVVTGLGTINPLGNSVDETWRAICAGASGITGITKFDPTNYRTRIAGELKNFDPLTFLTPKEVRRFDDFIIYALAAVEMALSDSKLVIDESRADRVGVFLASGIGGISTIIREHDVLRNGGSKKISPFLIPAALPNLAAGNVAIRFGAKGPITCHVTACSAGNNAIGEAYRTIAFGYADAMIAGGVEAPLTPLAVAGFNAMRALSTRNEDPEKASRPFDRDRDGFVMGEGCGVIIMEELGHALRRGAPIYGEVAGYGLTSDAYHVAAPPPGHPGAVRCMRLALHDAGMGPADIDYVNAHGTSTQLNDEYELEAIKKVFLDENSSPAVSSTKSMTGHLLGAAGGVEAVISIKSIVEGIVPPTTNLDNPIEAWGIDLVSHRVRKSDIRTVMSNAFGFGGVNTVVIYRKFQEEGL